MALMIKQGQVLENNNGHLQVMIERMEACWSCAIKESCSQSEETIVELYSTDDLKKGDKVILTSDSKDITKFSMLVYVFPVIMMVIGAAIPQLFLQNSNLDINLLSLLFVLGFLAISFAIVKGVDKKIKDETVMKVRKI